MLDWLNFHFVQIQLLWTDFQWPKNCMNPHNISHDIDMHCTCAAQWPRQIFNCAASMWLVQGPRVLPRTLQISVWFVSFCSSSLNSSNSDHYPQQRTKFSSLISIKVIVWFISFCSSSLNSSNSDLYPQPRTKFSLLISVQISVWFIPFCSSTLNSCSEFQFDSSNHPALQWNFLNGK